MLMQPRNTLVAVRLIENNGKMVGAIYVPGNMELYSEAEVLAVGPGNRSAAGAVPETHDLKAGQVVFVKSTDIRLMGGQMAKSKAGIPYENGGDKYTIFEQASIIGIIAESMAEYEVKRAANNVPKLVLAN